MIDTEALRKKVIDLAIQGKLTEQLPEDGSAEDLYVQIQEEKEKLIKEGKLKKQKPLPEIEEDEIPFEIPKNWKWVRLGKITYIERGGSPRPIKNYLTDSENGINWIKIGDVEKGGKYICSTKERIIPEGEKKSRHVYPGDFLLTNSMSFGRPYISKIEGCIHDGWLLVRDIKGINSDFLYFLLSSSYMYKQFCKKAAGAAVDNLNIDRVNSAMMPFPTISEQKRIVELIESTFKQIDIIDELQNKYNNDVEVLKSKVIDAATRGELTEQLPEDGNAEDLYNQIQEEKEKLIKEGKIKKQKPLPEIEGNEIPFEIPKNWRWVRVEALGENVNNAFADGPFGSNLKKEHYSLEHQVRIIQLSNVGADGWKNENEKYTTYEHLKSIKRSEVEVGNIVIAKMMPAGRAIIVPNVHDSFVLSSDCVKIVPHRFINSKYLLYAINSEMFRKQVYKNVSGVGRVRTSLSKIKNYLLPLPSFNEQQRIANKLDMLIEYMK